MCMWSGGEALSDGSAGSLCCSPCMSLTRRKQSLTDGQARVATPDTATITAVEASPKLGKLKPLHMQVVSKPVHAFRVHCSCIRAKALLTHCMSASTLQNNSGQCGRSSQCREILHRETRSNHQQRPDAFQDAVGCRQQGSR